MEQGQLLAGRYRLTETLGRGGMSVVWRAHDEVLGREVAVKMLAPRLAADEGLLDRIRTEARAAARTCHPHIVDVHDYGEEQLPDGPVVPYVVMEIVDGRPLADVVRDEPLPWPTAVQVCAEVAGAVAAAHACGIVHRDVTPGNVMLTRSGAKLVDFGISAAIGEADLSPGGLLLGTPAYLAPERLDGGPVQPAGDVYALGLLLYKTLTGHLPWQLTTTTEMLAAHRYVDPAPLPPVPGLPEAVADLCRRCLAKRPEDRPTSAEVARELGAPVPADQPWAGRAAVPTDVPLTPTAAMSRTLGRLLPSRRRLAAALAAVGILLAVVLGGSWVAPDKGGVAAFGAEPTVLGSAFGPRQVPCRVRYELNDDRRSRFTAAVTVTNAGTVPLAEWRLDFSFPADQQVVRMSGGGQWRQAGRAVTLTGQALPAGRAVTMGLDGSYRGGSNPMPTTFRVNDGACVPELVAPQAQTERGDDDDDDEDNSGPGGGGGPSGGGKGKRG